jgi:CHAD domain-containing protein
MSAIKADASARPAAGEAPDTIPGPAGGPTAGGPTAGGPTAGEEREAKLSVEPGWALPDLRGVGGIDRVEELPEIVLEAVYFDTPDLRLVRQGATLRHRTARSGTPGEAPELSGAAAERAWTLKLPQVAEEAPAPALRRTEFVWPGDPGAVPPEALDLVRGLVRTATLQPVGRLQSTRRRYRLLSSPPAGARPVAEIDDDRVEVLDVADPAPARGEFRELEVELGPAARKGALAAILERLHGAGAAPGVPLPKIVRALGPAALEAPDPAAPALHPGSTLSELVAAAIAEGVTALTRYDPALRRGPGPEGAGDSRADPGAGDRGAAVGGLGAGDGIEPVHKARVATRRLRSHLRTFRPVLDPAWLAATEPDLRWIAGVLGSVRDADVMRGALAGEVKELAPGDAPAGGEILTWLAGEREEAERVLRAALSSDAYVALLDRLVAGVQRPPLRVPTEEARSTPAARVLPALVAKPYKRLRRMVKALPPDPADQALHEVRKRAKHLRYACELAAPVIGHPARKLASAAEELQQILGEQHDAVVLADRLRGLAASSTPEQALVLGEVLTRSLERAQQRRQEWHRAYSRVKKKPRRSWLRRAELPAEVVCEPTGGAAPLGAPAPEAAGAAPPGPWPAGGPPA